jgi:hypothetical protein
MEWLSFKFNDEMTKENYGSKWHADLTSSDEQMICFNWKNLSPETPTFNLQKNNKIIKSQIEEHIIKLKMFCKLKKIEEPKEFINLLKSKI